MPNPPSEMRAIRTLGMLKSDSFVFDVEFIFGQACPPTGGMFRYFETSL